MRRVMLAVLAAAMLIPGGARAADQDLASFVDPFIGTLGAGFVFPGAAAPFGMVQNSPDTEGYFAYTGYQYSDRAIRGFSLVHVQSMGVPEGGYVPLMPTTGAIVTDVKQYQQPFTHAAESASPGAYAVHLQGSDIETELTAGLRIGMQRYTFPAGARANVLLDVGRQVGGSKIDDVGQTTPGSNVAAVHIVGPDRVEGVANADRANGEGYAVYFSARFDAPFASFGTWGARGATAVPGRADVSGKGAGAYVSFANQRTVMAKIGISFTSVENARGNLEAEAPGNDFNFGALRARTRAAWDDALHSIVVEGGLDTDKTSFYTSLYHAQHHPNIFEDANGEYIGHDNRVYRVGVPGDALERAQHVYANFSLWDTYRAEMPLLEMIVPDRVRDMMRSLAATIRNGGRLPRWDLMNRYADYMIGEPAIQTVADAACRGLVPDEVAAPLYDGLRTLASAAGPHGEDALLHKYGFVPNDKHNVGVSATFELASAQFAFALVADSLGKTADRDGALALASAWKKVIDPASGFARPRNSDGSWVSPYLPENGDGFKEGTGWQYTWLVPHDFDALLRTVDTGSQPTGVMQRLDQFFSTPLSATVPYAPAEAQQKTATYGIVFYGNQYSPANETDLQAPYIFDWTDAAWKTQALSRQYQQLYRPAPDGLPGNDDLGTMSAWLVWSDLGFYPVIPGSPIYAIGSPLFERAQIRLGDRTFTVEAPDASHVDKYVSSVAVGSQAPTHRTYLTQDAFDADRVVFKMSSQPDPSGLTIAPPSQSSAASLAAFGCST